MLKIFITIILFSGISITACTKKNNEIQKPNFLVIIADDMAFRAIGYNNDIVHTPNLDSLAGDGLIFNNAYITTPICAASRASLMTGLYPQTNGTVALNSRSFIKNVVTDKKFKTLPQILKENANYTTWFCGKSHLKEPKNYGFQFGEETYDFDDESTFEDAYNFINEIAELKNQQPFLLWVATRQPHVPLFPNNKWLSLYNVTEIPLDKNFREKPVKKSFFNQGLPGENYYRDSDYTNNYKNLPAGPPRSPEIIREFSRAYYATISRLDYKIGELIKQMDSKGLMENTLVIFLSDNGYFLGNHGLGNKLTMHEESVKVPFFIYWDKLKKNCQHTNALISSIDIFPTILELAEINIPDYCQGVSLNPILSDSVEKTRDYVVSESVGVGGSLGQGHRMVVTDKWKYILSDIGDEALFNIGNDPYELNNLINDNEYPEKVNELKTNLIEWKKLTGDSKKIPD
jgi:arylsulfatase A-like enzyme